MTRDGENADLFPANVAQWAYQYSATVLESLDDVVKLLESEVPTLGESIAETLGVAERI